MATDTEAPQAHLKWSCSARMSPRMLLATVTSSLTCSSPPVSIPIAMLSHSKSSATLQPSLVCRAIRLLDARLGYSTMSTSPASWSDDPISSNGGECEHTIGRPWLTAYAQRPECRPQSTGSAGHVSHVGDEEAVSPALLCREPQAQASEVGVTVGVNTTSVDRGRWRRTDQAPAYGLRQRWSVHPLH